MKYVTLLYIGAGTASYLTALTSEKRSFHAAVYLGLALLGFAAFYWTARI